MPDSQHFQFEPGQKGTINLQTGIGLTATCDVLFSDGVSITGLIITSIPISIRIDGFVGVIDINILSTNGDINSVATLN